MSNQPEANDSSALSRNLSEYLREVESATGRRVSLNPVPDSSIQTEVNGRLLIGPSYDDIHIEYGPALPPTHTAIEKAIAHELTHGFLIYAKGYPIVSAEDDVPEEIVQRAADIMDIVDDIIVDTMLETRGFLPTTPEHLQPFINNARVLTLAKLRSQVSTPYPNDPIRTEIKFVGDYLYAWGLPRFVTLDIHSQKVFKCFLIAFPKVMKTELIKAKRAKKLILGYDILTLDGRNRVLEGLLGLWQLESIIQLRTIDKPNLA